jgi:hypothetical protein
MTTATDRTATRRGILIHMGAVTLTASWTLQSCGRAPEYVLLR